MLALIIHNQKMKYSLSQIELKLHKTEIGLYAATWSMKRHYEFCRDYNLDEINDIKTILPKFTRIYYKFALTDCDICIEAELNNIKKVSCPVYILIETPSNRNFRYFVHMHQLDSAKTLRISKPLFKEGEEPLYFVVNEGKAQDLFFPFKENSDFSVEYLKIVQNKYSI